VVSATPRLFDLALFHAHLNATKQPDMFASDSYYYCKRMIFRLFRRLIFAFFDAAKQP
jgi:hypothetical protein